MIAAILGWITPQDNPTQPVAGQDIVVTGQGLARPPGERAYAVAELDRAAIEAAPSNRLEDVLRGVAGRSPTAAGGRV